ncbi:DUF1772 domain-containing protein [Moritella sp. F3]|uniref:DUF1772 domain-containing protein n=1 Tax=Moritella sp. F3 TaxID=2718882 RepID=UPI0018E16FA4|nr:DUF1772 domain-containing protein [Moritella sp. F3]GIC75767.1 hypothetical protein FMO001_04940 [Moritella sp. F1]GIC81785.1 hypothetical protein FMO003_20660 [Moritella sp. F3]
MIEIIAVLCAGTFFGAALYINLAQHPATLDTGGDFASKFFPPMYAKASTLQIALAVGGTVLGVISWSISGDIYWLIGAVFLVSVVPITIFIIKPINDQLLDSANKLEPEAVVALLKQWNPRHWVRSGVSFVAFFCYILAISA